VDESREAHLAAPPHPPPNGLTSTDTADQRGEGYTPGARRGRT
jgi:hypothetical protein